MDHSSLKQSACHLPRQPLQVIPIISIPGFGDRAAERVCTDMKIQSQNDREKLDEAKKQVYLKGFTDGVLTVGPHAGKKVRPTSALQFRPLLHRPSLEADLP